MDKIIVKNLGGSGVKSVVIIKATEYQRNKKPKFTLQSKYLNANIYETTKEEENYIIAKPFAIDEAPE